MTEPERPVLDEAELRPLVDAFYTRVRADPQLAPVFAAGVADWDEHLARLTDFWSSVMLSSGTYKGNPMAAHLRHAADITPALFARWLDLWQQVTADRLSPAAAAAMQAKAARIAQSLQLGIATLGSLGR